MEERENHQIEIKYNFPYYQKKYICCLTFFYFIFIEIVRGFLLNLVPLDLI